MTPASTPQQLQAALKLWAALLRESPDFKPWACRSGASCPLPTFVAIVLMNTESLNFAQCPSHVIPWCLGWLYVKSASGSNKKKSRSIVFFLKRVLRPRGGEEGRKASYRSEEVFMERKRVFNIQV